MVDQEQFKGKRVLVWFPKDALPHLQELERRVSTKELIGIPTSISKEILNIVKDRLEEPQEKS